MNGIWAGWRGGILVPGAAALLLALAGAVGLGPCFGGAGGTATVVDLSPSCELLDDPPDDAFVCRDSRLGRALEEAKRGGAKRILLFTDGCDLSGARPELPGVPVDVVLLPRRDDVTVLSMKAPDRIPVATDFAVEIVLGRTRGPPRPPLTAGVTLFRDGERVGSPVAARLERGQTVRVLVRDRVDREGVVRYRATADDPVGERDDDELVSVVRIGERPLVVSIGGPLDVPGCTVQEVSHLSLAAGPHPALHVADAVVVRMMPDVFTQAAIVDVVRKGAGLVVTGGRGVAGSPLEKVLPLTDTPPEGRAALLLLDVSGSMDELMDDLAEATERLIRHFAPEDRVACLLFSDRPLEAFPWRPAAEARFDLRARKGAGNTLLDPALAEAERILAGAKGARRLFVISDGEWKDLQGGALKQRLARFGGIHRAALFVKEDVPSEARDLFPVSLAARDDLGEALERLEDKASDRTVASADAAEAPAPAWLEGAVPRAGTYRDFARLYPRGVGEVIVLAAGEIPVVAAWRPGGKVVLCAARDVDPTPLSRAVLRDTGRIRLRAWREGDGMVAEASGSDGAPFLFGERSVPARPVGRDRWRATVELAPAGAVVVTCGSATLLVGGSNAELAGLGNRKDIAAAIAAASGGRLLEAGGLPGAIGAKSAAPFATLLLAALLVTLSAWRRRRA